MPIRSLKARKALYGFEVKFSQDKDDLKLCCDFISDALEYEDITVEHKQNMATVDVIKFYTDSQPVGEFLKSNYC